MDALPAGDWGFDIDGDVVFVADGEVARIP